MYKFLSLSLIFCLQFANIAFANDSSFLESDTLAETSQLSDEDLIELGLKNKSHIHWHHHKHHSHSSSGSNAPGPVPIIPLTHSIYVDVNTLSAAQDGSIGNPLNSIQAALDSIPPGTNAFEKARSFTIYVASGIYNESLTINSNNNQIELVALGSVYLSDPTFSDPRHVVINFTANTLPPNTNWGDTVSFTSLNSRAFFNNVGQAGQLGQFYITGFLQINDVSSIASVTNLVQYTGTVLGGVNASGSTKENVIEFDNAYVDFFVNFPMSILNARNTVFQSPLTGLSYGVIENSSILGGMQITQIPSVFTGNGAGIYSSNLAGVFTLIVFPNDPIPFNGILLDTESNFWLSQNGGTVFPPVTKTLIFNPIP